MISNLYCYTSKEDSNTDTSNLANLETYSFIRDIMSSFSYQNKTAIYEGFSNKEDTLPKDK